MTSSMNADDGQRTEHVEVPPQSEERFRLLVDSVRDYAIFMLDPDGHVLTWNAGAERFKGYQAGEIIGSHFSRFYPPEALARRLPEHELEVARRDGSFEDDGWRVRKDGSMFWANVVITAMRDEAGMLVGYAEVTRDLTQGRNHNEALRRSEERFRLLVDGVTEYAIFMLDLDGRVATWNAGAQRINGYTNDEILGRHFSIFYPQEAKDRGWPAHELQVAAEKGCFADNGWRVRKDGSRLWANVTITALRDDAGHLVGFAKLTRDMTENQRAVRIKDEFLDTLSHELRTPLSAILGWTQVLLRGQAGEAAGQRRAIEVIDRNARAQVQLIDDLLDLSRIIAGKVRLDLRQVSLPEVAQSALDSAQPVAAAKNIRLLSLFDQGRATVSADSGRLQQVVWNLLTNAIKFTPQGGQVQVLLQRADSHVELSVVDSGIGIPASFLPHVFERFSQQDSSTTRVHGGLGLGLAIATQLAELHGGAIRAASAGEGQGSTFTLRLPISLMQTDDEREHGHAPPTGDTRVDLPLPLPRLDGIRAFIVDDEPDARHLLARVFEAQGASVATFDSAAALLAALATSTPAIIISDIGMPGMDGYQMIRLLRARDTRETRIPALALTAFASAEDRQRALLAGYQAHLAKPFDVAALVRLVADLVGR